jgi:predicted molibdopterin-dependent oxidoreductase YjgC
LTGIDENTLMQVSDVLAEGRSTLFLYGAGLSQPGPDPTNASAIFNLALLSGGQVLPLGLESNDRGLFELSNLSSERAVAKDQILQGVSEGNIKGLYLLGSVPLPKTKKTCFVVVQSSYLEKNSEKADVLLPATTFAETEGIYVNVEGRIQMSRKLIDPLGDAKPDWWIFSQLARRLNVKGFDYKKQSDIQKEIRQVCPEFAVASSASLEKGKEIFVKEEQKGTAGFSPMKFELPSSEVTKKYPFKMILRPNQNSYRNVSLSMESRGFAVLDNSRWIRMNPEDAKKLGLKNEDPLVVESSKGKMKGILKISGVLPQGMIESQLVWNEEPSLSALSLVFPWSNGSYLQEPIPVKIKRG